MKKNKELICIILSLILIGVIIYSSAELSLWIDRHQRAESLRASHDIVILDDKDFTKYYNFSGSGTESDPYLIENLQLLTNKVTGIWIERTTKHFVIRNCSIIMKYQCIFLSEVAPNTATIKNCFLRINNTETKPSGIGISINYSQGVELINNTCIGPSNESNWSTLPYRIDCMGIDIWASSYCKIVDSKITNWYDGISMEQSDYAQISSNNLTHNRHSGISDNMSWRIIISSNICHNSKFGIYIESTTFSTVSYNNLCFNDYGLFCDGSFLTIFNNNCSLNSYYGMICFPNTRQSIISENTCSNNRCGISFYEGSEINITKNNLEYNSHYGLEIIESDNLIIFQNNFIGNCYNETLLGRPQAYEELRFSQNNFWYNSFSSLGNYWSDLTWDEAAVYYIDGSNSTDLYPIENPVNF